MEGKRPGERIESLNPLYTYCVLIWKVYCMVQERDDHLTITIFGACFSVIEGIEQTWWVNGGCILVLLSLAIYVDKQTYVMRSLRTLWGVLEYSSLCWRRTSSSLFYDEWTSWSSVYQCNEIQYVPCQNDHYLTHIPFLPELRFEWVLSMFPQSTDETSTIRPMSFMSKVWAYTHYMLYHINDTLAWRSSHCYDGSWSRPKSSKGAGLSSVAW